MAAEMVLRGFAGRLGDLRGRMRFCHPLLSSKANGTDLFVATDMHWRSDGTGLKYVNEDDLSAFGTLWRESKSTTGPGVGVALIGREFMREVSTIVETGELENLPFTRDDELGCWIAIGRRVEFDACAERLARIARLVFDRELRRSASEAGKLSRAGAAALFVLRRTPGRRDTDVAIRELAAANIQDEHDLYRRLLAVLSAKLNVDADALDTWVKQHVESIRSAAFVGRLDPKNARLVRQVKSSRFPWNPRVWVHGVLRSASPSKAFTELQADKWHVVFEAAERVVRSTIVHDRPLESGSIHSARIGQVNSGFEGAHLWKKMETTPSHRKAHRLWMSKR